MAPKGYMKVMKAALKMGGEETPITGKAQKQAKKGLADMLDFVQEASNVGQGAMESEVTMTHSINVS